MIVVLGSTNTDMVISGAKIPVPGEPVKGADWFRDSLPIHLVSALWGILVWREFAGAPRMSHVLNLAMLVLFVAGLACLVKAGA